MPSHEADANRRRLDDARAEARECRRCELWQRGTRTVFGEGAAGAVLMLVGEHPGDLEDRKGRPFVGPAGTVLREALAEAGLAHVPLYVTNAVKHVNWEPQGKRRLYLTPKLSHLVACRAWLEEEIAAVAPRVLVALGASAAMAVLGPNARLAQERGRWLPSTLPLPVLLTVNPSAVLRGATAEAREASRRALVEDLRMVAERLAEAPLVTMPAAGGAAPGPR